MTDPSLFKQGVSYTKSEQVLIDYIITSPQEFLALSIQELARRLGVSDATVSRFARHAGFADFKALKAAVGACVIGPADKLSASVDEVGGDARAFLRQQRSCIDITIEGLDMRMFGRAVEQIAGARRVYLHGKGAAVACVELLRFRLARYGVEVEQLASGGTELMEGLAHAQADDVLVLFGFQRVPVEGQVLLDYGSRRGCTTILFTDRMVRGDHPRADIELYTYRGESRSYHSMTSAIALVDALVVAVAARLGDDALATLEDIRDLKREYAHLLPR